MGFMGGTRTGPGGMEEEEDDQEEEEEEMVEEGTGRESDEYA
jgi:hypothetical protein